MDYTTGSLDAKVIHRKAFEYDLNNWQRIIGMEKKEAVIGNALV